MMENDTCTVNIAFSITTLVEQSDTEWSRVGQSKMINIPSNPSMTKLPETQWKPSRNSAVGFQEKKLNQWHFQLYTIVELFFVFA